MEEELDPLTKRIIGCAIALHRHVGPGLLESVYRTFIVQNEVVVEVKCASSHDRVFDAQVLTYLRLTGLRKGLLLNFGRPTLKDGIKRFAL